MPSTGINIWCGSRWARLREVGRAFPGAAQRGGRGRACSCQHHCCPEVQGLGGCRTLGRDGASTREAQGARGRLSGSEEPAPALVPPVSRSVRTSQLRLCGEEVSCLQEGTADQGHGGAQQEHARQRGVWSLSKTEDPTGSSSFYSGGDMSGPRGPAVTLGTLSPPHPEAGGSGQTPQLAAWADLGVGASLPHTCAPTTSDPNLLPLPAGSRTPAALPALTPNSGKGLGCSITTGFRVQLPVISMCPY